MRGISNVRKIWNGIQPSFRDVERLSILPVESDRVESIDDGFAGEISRGSTSDGQYSGNPSGRRGRFEYSRDRSSREDYSIPPFNVPSARMEREVQRLRSAINSCREEIRSVLIMPIVLGGISAGIVAIFIYLVVWI